MVYRSRPLPHAPGHLAKRGPLHEVRLSAPRPEGETLPRMRRSFRLNLWRASLDYPSMHHRRVECRHAVTGRPVPRLATMLRRLPPGNRELDVGTEVASGK